MKSENLIKNYSIPNYFLKLLNLGVLLFYHVKSSLRVTPSYFFLFLGLLFSTATKLRLPGLPLGPSEIFFLLFAVTAYIRDELDWRSKKYLHYVILLLFLLLISNIGAIYHNFQNTSSDLFFHDNLSFLYTLFLTWLFLTYKGSLEKALKTTMLMTLCLAVLIFLICNIYGSFFTLGVLLFYHLKSRPRITPTYFFLFLGLLFSTATKLRLPGLPLGPSEVFFLLFAVTAYIRDELDWHSKKYLHYVILLLFFLLISNIRAFHDNFQNTSSDLFFHDNLSFLYILPLAWLFLTYKGTLEKALKTTILMTLCLAVLIFLTCNIYDSFFSYFYYYSWRFSFFSINPNQFALLLVPFPFFIMHFYRSSYEKKDNFWSKLSLTLIFMSGLCTIPVLSSAVFFSWGISFLFIIHFYMKNYTRIDKIFYIFWYGFIYILFIAILTVLFDINIFYLYFSDNIADKLYNIFRPIQSELDIRLNIWSILIEDLAKSWFIFGYGPGSLIKVNSSSFEAHNTLLGILYSGGIIPFVLTIYGLYMIGKHASSKGYFLLLSFISLLLFSMFHSFLRMPILWFYFVYLYKECEEKDLLQGWRN